MSRLKTDVVPKLLSCTHHRQKLKLWFLLLTITIFYILISSLSAQATPSAKTYYVATNGNDNNPGTLAKPWRHINYATTNNIVKPGDTVYVRGGTYKEYIPQQISGSEGNYITYRNYPAETPIITNDNRSRSWRWQILDQSYIRIDGFTFYNYYSGAIQVRTRETNLSHIEIVNNMFERQNMDGSSSNKAVYITTSTDEYSIEHILIQNNYFRDLNTGVSSANEALMVSGTVSKVAILGNRIEDVTNIGIDIAGRPDKGQPSQILIKGNEIYNYGTAISVAGGIYLDGAGSQIVIEENIVHDGPKGIHVNLESAASSLTTEQVIIRHNILYNNKINLKLGVAGANDECNRFGHLMDSVAIHNTVYADRNNTANHYFSCGENLRWKNNIFAHSTTTDGAQYKLINDSADPSSWITDYNFFQNNGDIAKYYHWEEKRYEDLTHFQDNVQHEAHSFEGDPMFVDPSKRDFDLQSNSMARDRGGALTWTRSAGNGTIIPVDEALYFSDGMGLQAGDIIRIDEGNPLQIVEVNYNNNRITVDTAVSWYNQSSITYDYSGTAPDMGAKEYNPTFKFSVQPQDQSLQLSWDVNETLSEDTQWKLEYGVADQSMETILLSNNERTHILNQLTNYQIYTITLTAFTDSEVKWSQTVQSMPTDIFMYLPIVSK